MGAGFIAVNVFFALFVLVVIPGVIVWAIHTAHRDAHPSAPVLDAPVLEPETVALEPADVEVALA